VRIAPQTVLTPQEESELVRLVRSKTCSVRLAERARIVLLAARGLQDEQIAAEVGVGSDHGRSLAPALHGGGPGRH
jgi:hypothetical protein